MHGAERVKSLLLYRYFYIYLSFFDRKGCWTKDISPIASRTKKPFLNQLLNKTSISQNEGRHAVIIWVYLIIIASPEMAF